MAILHEIRQGEGLSSLAAAYGLLPETIWNDPANAELKRLRGDGNVLLPGDIVTIPDTIAKSLPAVAGVRHRFRARNVPARLQLRLTVNGEPRANQHYMLKIDGQARYGKTDADGWIDIAVPPAAKEGRLVIGSDRRGLLLRFGHLDPVTEPAGVQARLINLGFLRRAASGVWDAATRNALRRFQQKNSLAVTGEHDAETLALLLAQHDRARSG
jgi:hypothetical protein